VLMVGGGGRWWLMSEAEGAGRGSEERMRGMRDREMGLGEREDWSEHMDVGRDIEVEERRESDSVCAVLSDDDVVADTECSTSRTTGEVSGVGIEGLKMMGGWGMFSSQPSLPMGMTLMRSFLRLCSSTS